MNTMYAAYVLANRGRAPSPSFLAVLNALEDLGGGGAYITQVAHRSGVERVATSRLLRRMVQLGIAYQWDGERGELGGAPRVYYSLTVAGRELAEQIMAGVA